MAANDKFNYGPGARASAGNRNARHAPEQQEDMTRTSHHLILQNEMISHSHSSAAPHHHAEHDGAHKHHSHKHHHKK